MRDYRSVHRKTTHTQFGDGLLDVDGDWSRHHTSARTRLPTRRPHTGQSDGLPERGQEDHTHSSATDYIMSTATNRATRPAPTSNQQPEDHTQLRATNYQMVDRKTTHTHITATDCIMSKATGRTISPAPDVPHITHTYTYTYIYVYTHSFIHSFIYTYIHHTYTVGQKNCTFVDFAIAK